MIRRYLYLVSLLLLALILPWQLRGEETAVTPTPTGLPTDQLIIQFNEIGLTRHVQTTEPGAFLPDLSQSAGTILTYVHPLGLPAHHVLKLPERLPEAEVAAIAAALSQRDDVLFAAPDRIKQHFGPPEGQSPEAGSTNYLPIVVRPNPIDPLRSQQWHYDFVAGSTEGINLYKAWGITTGSSNVVVAVVDTGILPHLDLAGRVLPGYDFIADLFVANDGNGRDSNPADPGDWVNAGECGATQFYPSSWHGTHVAGTIGAATNNGVGVAGVDQKARILPIRALGKCGGYESDIVAGVLWAAGFSVAGVPNNPFPAKVVNLSLGGPGSCSFAEQNAFNMLWNAGVTAVVAAGNSAQNAALYSPGNCNNVITVAANNRGGDLAYYSNYGGIVNVSAPGGETFFNNDSRGVLSTLDGGTTTPLNNNIYMFYQGTSMAAPHVAGVAALIYSIHPGYSPGQILNVLQNTARPFAPGTSCDYYSDCGAGIVDAYRALGGSALAVDTPWQSTAVGESSGR